MTVGLVLVMTSVSIVVVVAPFAAEEPAVVDDVARSVITLGTVDEESSPPVLSVVAELTAPSTAVD